jgi:hypothetical protein
LTLYQGLNKVRANLRKTVMGKLIVVSKRVTGVM